ncbi:MAG: hypothetical protein U5K75_04520, partial [Ahrensia sp.]|nr:hypothetical protein [Ahrensia sp.]
VYFRSLRIARLCVMGLLLWGRTNHGSWVRFTLLTEQQLNGNKRRFGTRAIVRPLGINEETDAFTIVVNEENRPHFHHLSC